LVMLSTKNLKATRPNRKLSDRFLGPFKVVRVLTNGMSYELKLPPSFKIFPVFHVSLLEPYHLRAGATLEPPEPELIRGAEEWEVEAILGHRKRGKKVQYLVHWKGFSHAEDTWEPVANLENAGQELKRYREQNVDNITASSQGAKRARRGKR
jgi:hypothetical protein